MNKEKIYKEKNYKIFFKKNVSVIKSVYDVYLKLLKEDCGNPNGFAVDFKVFCHMYWKAYLYSKDGDNVSPWSMIGDRITFYHSISNFVREYASKLIDISNEDYLETQKNLSYRELYKTTYLIYSSMLACESSYFDKMNAAISKTELYKNASKKAKKQFDEQVRENLLVNQELESERDDSRYFFEKNEHKGKWSDVKKKMFELYQQGGFKNYKDAIEALIEKGEDKTIRKTLIKNGNNMDKIIQSILRSISR